MSIEDGTVSDMELDEAEDEVIEEEFEEEDTPPVAPPVVGHDQGLKPGQVVKLRDLREYVVLGTADHGVLVGELENDFSKFGNVFLWRNETIADLKKKNRILEVK